MLNGDGLSLTTDRGEPVRDDTFLIFFNAHHEDFDVSMPGHVNVRWRLILDTAEESGFVQDGVLREGGGQHKLTARSLAIFQLEAGTGDEARDIRGRRIAGPTRPPIPPPRMPEAWPRTQNPFEVARRLFRR